MNTSKYRKAVVAVGAAVAEIVRVTADGDLTTSEGIGIAIVVAGALGVYGVANKEQ